MAAGGHLATYRLHAAHYIHIKQGQLVLYVRGIRSYLHDTAIKTAMCQGRDGLYDCESATAAEYLQW
jgi:hypothetical protein